MVRRAASNRKKYEVDRHYRVAEVCFFASFTMLAIIVSFTFSVSAISGWALALSVRNYILYLTLLIMTSIVFSTLALIKEPTKYAQVKFYARFALMFDILTLVLMVLLLAAYLFAIPTY